LVFSALRSPGLAFLPCGVGRSHRALVFHPRLGRLPYGLRRRRRDDRIRQRRAGLWLAGRRLAGRRLAGRRLFWRSRWPVLPPGLWLALASGPARLLARGLLRLLLARLFW
jgi:hypothetical protein